MATCDELATQLTGLQSHLITLQKELDNPDEACADFTGRAFEECIQGLRRNIATTQTEIASIQQQQKAQWCSIRASDGTPLTVRTDTQGRVVAAEAVGTDGVKHSFTRTSSFNQNTQGWYYTAMRQEFFENDQRYFYVTTWIYLWARKVSMSMADGGKNYGFSINFPDDGSHDSTPITIASGSLGQQFTVTQGTLRLNQGSISAPSFTANFAVPPEIAQQIIKIAYFQPLFDQENTQYTAQAASDLQAAGIDPNMTLNEALYGQGAGQAAMTLRPFAGEGEKGRDWNKTLAIGLCRISGGLSGILAGVAVTTAFSESGPAAAVAGSTAGVIVGQTVTTVCVEYVESNWDQAPPPAPPPDNPDMRSMPPDASVPIDSGDPSGMDTGGPGVCVQPPSEQSQIVPFEETTGSTGDCM